MAGNSPVRPSQVPYTANKDKPSSGFFFSPESCNAVEHKSDNSITLNDMVVKQGTHELNTTMKVLSKLTSHNYGYIR